MSKTKTKITYTEPITFRFPADEYPELAKRARALGMGVNLYARSLVLREMRRKDKAA